MKKIEIFDPALCCSTGVCGATPDDELVRMAGIVESLKKKGYPVTRYNLGQEPAKFAENTLVKNLLETEGSSALPIVIIDEVIAFSKSYPQEKDLLALL
ncbi:arsenite efflux transporter metallochaperone ArsD [Ignatzschineria indica]|uniref:arsenite efflux transporter metallochaperone ArsD n=1 Tax=Ignatzschineria indica TaxID=472583 RepID=UPI002576C9C5|nr:arsenite efflux transporter metallochaperone ArsD [Ignatzschineria indica]MDM1544505.1 arsenite efflux transporter metallochaperone ArsD [Ignatzschineria indica]